MPNNMTILVELSAEYEVSGRMGFPGDPRAKEKILQDYRRGEAVQEVALKIAPDDVRLLHGYAIGLSEIGVTLESTDPQESLKMYLKDLEIDRKLTQLFPDLRYRRGVAMAYGSIASVYDDMARCSSCVALF